MAPLYNAPYGRSSKVILPPEYSSPKSRLNDYCLKNRNDANTMAWIDRQSKTIAAAFSEPWRPRIRTRCRRPRNQCGGNMNKNRNANTNVEMKDGIMPGDTSKDQDAILEFTTLMDARSAELTVTSQWPYTANQVGRPFVPVQNNIHTRKKGGNELKETDTTATSTEVSPIDLLSGIPELAGGRTKTERPRYQTWKINSQGHLITSKSLSTKLAVVKVASPNTESPLPLESAAVARLAAENQQLAAFQQALRFALNDAFTHTNEVKFTAEVGLYNHAPGISYPTINILMEDWKEDTELPCRLAYYLLRGMLKRYRDLPFPDRVDIRESGAERGRLLVPYGAGRKEMDGEGERVRRRIVDEVRLERGLAGEGSENKGC